MKKRRPVNSENRSVTRFKRSSRRSMKTRYIVERFFAWPKSSGRLRQTMLRGTEKVGWEFHVFCAAFNLRKLALAG